MDRFNILVMIRAFLGMVMKFFGVNFLIIFKVVLAMLVLMAGPMTMAMFPCQYSIHKKYQTVSDKKQQVRERENILMLFLLGSCRLS